MPIIVDLDVALAKKKMGVGEFAAAVGIAPANVTVLKNNRAKAIRFTTLDAICRVLDCQPGDILRWTPDPESPQAPDPTPAADPTLAADPTPVSLAADPTPAPEPTPDAPPAQPAPPTAPAP